MRAGAFCSAVAAVLLARAWATPDDSARTVRIGAGLMGGVSVHVADFSSLPELQSCCPRFRDGSGLAAATTLWGEYPIGSSLALGLRIGAAWFGGALRSLERKPVLVDDTPTDAVIQHTLQSQFRAMRWEGYLGVRASTLLDVYLGVGTDLLQTADASIAEELVQPAQGTFENGQRVRNTQRATLASSTRSMASLIAGMRFTVGLDPQRRWSLVPELTFRYGLDPVVRTNPWYLYSVLVGIGIAFEPVPYRFQPQPPPSTEPLEQPLPPRPLEASIVAYGVGAGREQLPLRLVRQARLRVMPLYPVLYTDGGSELPERYVLPLSPDDTAWRATLQSPLAAYYALLPILAERLRTRDDTLTITGYDARSVARARQRAEFVARYLHAIWKVPAERLRILARADERDTTARILLDGSVQLFAPLENRDTVQQIQPLLLRLRPATNGAQPLRRWSVQLRQDSILLALQEGSGGLPLRLDIDLAEQSDRLREDLPLSARVTVESTQGTQVTAETMIPIEHTTDAAEPAAPPTSAVEYFFFPDERPTAAFVQHLAATYRHRLRDLAIITYGGHSQEINDAVEHLRRLLLDAALPEPRLRNQPPLYRPITPERVIYGQMIVVSVHYVEEHR